MWNKISKSVVGVIVKRFYFMNFWVSWIYYIFFNCRWDWSLMGDFILVLLKGEIKNFVLN